MMNNNLAPRYSSILVFIHWLTVLAVISAFFLVWSLEIFDLESIEKNIVFIHKSLGLTVISLTLLRVLLTISGQAGTGVEETDTRLKLAAKLGHLGLYGFLFVVPVLGWAKSSAAGRAISMFGIPLPALVEKNRDLANLFGELHEVCAYVFLGLIALHIAAALWHSVVRKDGVMYSMLPIKRLLP